MQLVYLTWGETPRGSGVYGSQVIGQLLSISRNAKIHTTLIAGLPLIHSGLVKEKLAYFSELRNIRQRLGNIGFEILLLPAIQTSFYSNKKNFFSLHCFVNANLINKLKKIQPDIVHCRSYHAAYAAIIARKKAKLDYKIIFDARGLWPEEAVLKNKVSYLDNDFHFLKEIEQEIIQSADVTICVSDTMSHHFQEIGAKRVDTIFLGASVNELLLDNRDKYKDCNNKTLCYIGALADSTWHKPEMLRRVYAVFRSIYPNTKLLIVTHSDWEDIRACLNEFPESEIEFTSTVDRKEMASLLARADFGVLPYLEPISECEHKIANTVIAVKTAEYLAAGVPVLTNCYCGGAAELLEKWGVGLVYDPADPAMQINKESLQKIDTEAVRLRAVEVARQNFDFEKNALRYIALYNNILDIDSLGSVK